jgi:hypothetical protein
MIKKVDTRSRIDAYTLKISDLSTPKKLGSAFFQCVDAIEKGSAEMWKGDISCLEAIFRLVLSPYNYNDPFVTIDPSEYGGSISISSNLTERMRTEMVSRGASKGKEMYLSEAFLKFIINNPEAHPERPLCGTGGSINCLTHLYKMESNVGGSVSNMVADLPAMDSVIDIVNRGARCTLFDRSGLSSGASGTIGSCLEMILDRVLIKYPSYPDPAQHNTTTPFATVLGKYDWSVVGSGGVTAIQMLLDGGNSDNGRTYTTNFLNTIVSHYRDSPESANALMDVLLRDYDFKALDFPVVGGKRNLTEKYDKKSTSVRTNAVDYAFETGSSVAPVLGLLSNLGQLSSAPLCRSHVGYLGGSELQPCISKFLIKLTTRESPITPGRTLNWYSLTDIKVLDKYLSTIMNYSDFAHSVTSNDCLPNPENKEETCFDFMINNAGNKHLDVLTSAMLRSTPPTDYPCTIRSGTTPLVTNCLDRIMSLDGTFLKDEVVKSGVLLDRQDCTDGVGSKITCIDKLSQQHEAWLYLESYAHKLEEMTADAVKRGKSTSIIGEKRDRVIDVKKQLGVFNTPTSWDWVTGDYDTGKEKRHPLGKDYIALKPVLEEELALLDAQTTTPEIERNRNRRDYIIELLKTISSDVPQREVPIIIRLSKLYDANKNSGFMNTSNILEAIGLYGVFDTGRGSLTSLNMPDCPGETRGRFMSCMQKMVEVANDINKNRNISQATKSKLFNIYSMRDMLKPDLCDNSGTKTSCLEYAMNTLGLSGGSGGNAYVSLLARKDFRNIAQAKIILKNGTETTLGKEVCDKVSFKELERYLAGIMPGDQSTNGNSMKGGYALELYSICKCGDAKTPIELRQCADIACYEGFEGGHPSDQWYQGYFKNPELLLRPYRYNGSDDAFGIAGVYEVTYPPSQYIEVGTSKEATKRDVFNYRESVENELLPVLSRMVGQKMTKYENHVDVEIVDVIVIPPVEETDDFIVHTRFQGINKDGSVVQFTKETPVSEIFNRGGLLNRNDLRTHVVKFRKLETAVTKIMTRAKSEKTEAAFKLVLSNRPADFIRASNCQNWWSCMNFDSTDTNPAQMGHMGLGGYMAYLASDELSLRWFARSNVDPAMDLPGKPNNAFEIYTVYGLKPYKNLITDAIQMALYQAGYNHPQKIEHGHSPVSYIYAHRYGGWGTQWRHDGYMGNDYDNDYTGSRPEMVKKEIREEVTRKCIEKIASGENIVLKKVGVYDSVIVSNENECANIGNSIDTTPSQKGFTPSAAHSAGLLGMDLVVNWKNFRDISDYHESTSAVVNWQITDDIYKAIQGKGMVVKKVSPLTTTGTNQW